jgi:hypothetical protein
MAVAQVLKGAATATGQIGRPLGAPGGCPFSTYGLQVKGTGAAPTAWNVTLDGSLDNANWTTIVAHTNGTNADGATVWDTAGKANLFYRINVAALTLGSATDIKVSAVAVP